MTRIRPLPALCLALALLAAGCDNTVNPIIESDRFYSLYGFLTMSTDTQLVRVVPIGPLPDDGQAPPLGASVRSVDLTTGETVAWRDSLVRFADGSSGHVFYSRLRVEPGHAYRVEVEGGEGRLTTAETTVPAPPATALQGPRVFSEITQAVVWRDLPQAPLRVEMWYRFYESPGEPFLDVMVTGNDIRQTTPEGLEIRASLSKDKDDVLQALGRPPGSKLTLMNVAMRVFVLDEAWQPPGGVWDPEVLVQPGTFSNVRNGFGFVGAVGVFTEEWTLAPSVVRFLGFQPPGNG